MTEQGTAAARPWQDADFARRWAGSDGAAGLLALPRAIAASVVAHDSGDVRLIVDVGSGPGEFLAVMLAEFPGARGLWTDTSEAMRALAEERLAPFADRVDYALVDMTALRDGVPWDADVLTTSRASHHLDRPSLTAFYTEAVQHLAPGGWLVNLDHIHLASDTWDVRLRAVRKRFRSNGQESPPHHHSYPLTSIADHLDAFRAAGVDDVDIVWRAFITCLFMGRRPG